MAQNSGVGDQHLLQEAKKDVPDLLSQSLSSVFGTADILPSSVPPPTPPVLPQPGGMALGDLISEAWDLSCSMTKAWQEAERADNDGDPPAVTTIADPGPPKLPLNQGSQLESELTNPAVKINPIPATLVKEPQHNQSENSIPSKDPRQQQCIANIAAATKNQNIDTELSSQKQEVPTSSVSKSQEMAVARHLISLSDSTACPNSVRDDKPVNCEPSPISAGEIVAVSNSPDVSDALSQVYAIKSVSSHSKSLITVIGKVCSDSASPVQKSSLTEPSPNLGSSSIVEYSDSDSASCVSVEQSFKDVTTPNNNEVKIDPPATLGIQSTASSLSPIKQGAQRESQITKSQEHLQPAAGVAKLTQNDPTFQLENPDPVPSSESEVQVPSLKRPRNPTDESCTSDKSTPEPKERPQRKRKLPLKLSDDSVIKDSKETSVILNDHKKPRHLKCSEPSSPILPNTKSDSKQQPKPSTPVNKPGKIQEARALRSSSTTSSPKTPGTTTPKRVPSPKPLPLPKAAPSPKPAPPPLPTESERLKQQKLLEFQRMYLKSKQVHGVTPSPTSCTLSLMDVGISLNAKGEVTLSMPESVRKLAKQGGSININFDVDCLDTDNCLKFKVTGDPDAITKALGDEESADVNGSEESPVDKQADGEKTSVTKTDAVASKKQVIPMVPIKVEPSDGEMQSEVITTVNSSTEPMELDQPVAITNTLAPAKPSKPSNTVPPSKPDTPPQPVPPSQPSQPVPPPQPVPPQDPVVPSQPVPPVQPTPTEVPSLEVVASKKPMTDSEVQVNLDIEGSSYVDKKLLRTANGFISLPRFCQVTGTSLATVHKVMRNVKKGLSIDKKTKKPTWFCSLCNLTGDYGDLGPLYGPFDLYIPPKNSYRNKNMSDGAKNLFDKLSSTFSNDLVGSDEEDITVEREEVWLHEDCMCWSPGVYMIGFDVYGLEELFKIARFTACTVCSKIGASLGCFKEGCTNRYHYHCAVLAKCKLIKTTFTVLCPSHSHGVVDNCLNVNQFMQVKNFLSQEEIEESEILASTMCGYRRDETDTKESAVKIKKTRIIQARNKRGPCRPRKTSKESAKANKAVSKVNKQPTKASKEPPKASKYFDKTNKVLKANKALKDSQEPPKSSKEPPKASKEPSKASKEPPKASKYFDKTSKVLKANKALKESAKPHKFHSYTIAEPPPKRGRGRASVGFNTPEPTKETHKSLPLDIVALPRDKENIGKDLGAVRKEEKEKMEVIKKMVVTAQRRQKRESLKTRSSRLNEMDTPESEDLSTQNDTTENEEANETPSTKTTSVPLESPLATGATVSPNTTPSVTKTQTSRRTPSFSPSDKCKARSFKCYGCGVDFKNAPHIRRHFLLRTRTSSCRQAHIRSLLAGADKTIPEGMEICYGCGSYVSLGYLTTHFPLSVLANCREQHERLVQIRDEHLEKTGSLVGIDQLIWDEQISADEETANKVNGNEACTPTRTRRGATKAGASQRKSAVILTDTIGSRVEADSTLETSTPGSPEELEPPAATESLNMDREEGSDSLNGESKEGSDSLNGESKEGCGTVKVEVLEPPAMETSPTPMRTVLPSSPTNAKQPGIYYCTRCPLRTRDAHVLKRHYRAEHCHVGCADYQMICCECVAELRGVIPFPRGIQGFEYGGGREKADLSCLKCAKKSETFNRLSLRRHVRSAHCTRRCLQEDQICSECVKALEKMASWPQNLYGHDYSKGPPKVGFTCPSCGKIFERQYFTRHYRHKHCKSRCIEATDPCEKCTEMFERFSVISVPKS